MANKCNNGFYTLYWIPLFALWGLLCFCLYEGNQINQDIKKISSRKYSDMIKESNDISHT